MWKCWTIFLAAMQGFWRGYFPIRVSVSEWKRHMEQAVTALPCCSRIPWSEVSVIQNFKRGPAEAMKVPLLAFLQQLPGHWAIHQMQHTFLLNRAVIPFPPSCFKCFSRAISCVNFHQRRWKWCCSFWTYQDYSSKFMPHWRFVAVFLLMVAPS